MRGVSELSLLVALCAASWTRTPLGAAAEGLVDLARGEPTPDLLATFRTELPRALQESLDSSLVTDGLLAAAPSAEGLPTAWTAAVRTAVAAHLGEEALAQVETLAGPDGIDPEEALETWAVGAEVRDRAVRRARAAGEARPERYEAHRRYLPGEAVAEADRAVGETLALATVLDLAWPVDPEVRVTSGFGYRTHPVLGTRKLHEGVDLAVPVGTAVYAVGDGRVSRARFDQVNGNYVKLDHGHGVSSAYCHGETLRVARGDRVGRGQHVMDSGNTGRSTGPHLHFGLRIKGRAVDPAPFHARGAARALRVEGAEPPQHDPVAPPARAEAASGGDPV